MPQDPHEPPEWKAGGYRYPEIENNCPFHELMNPPFQLVEYMDKSTEELWPMEIMAYVLMLLLLFVIVLLLQTSSA